ncbi:hypothetical protein [Paenibacillus rhizophilus]|uniref:Tetratricopeptide repeat protein n=1 Tax=Paenibacillus rhizophilus TaxID=1850366 RepID=A0A3N9P4Q8_9BACL|nr:hypothetical protein [Paenibacillus rhizophilus]RQW10380.1 hypothetical protein EH198_16315 [Paenibacillus rhizophilus]
MRKMIILLFVAFFITSCAENSFDKYMRNGKDALIDKKFEDAINYFDLALIEEPNDKDAISLKERAEISLNKENDIKEFNQFKNDFDVIYIKLKQLGNGYDTFLYNLDQGEAKSKLIEAENLNDSIKKNSDKWSTNIQYKNLYNYLLSSSDNIKDMFMNASKDTPDNFFVTEGKSRSEIFNERVTSDPVTMARVSYVGYKGGLRDYQAEIDRIEGEINGTIISAK